jgi:hypothetical protein
VRNKKLRRKIYFFSEEKFSMIFIYLFIFNRCDEKEKEKKEIVIRNFANE